MTCRTVWLLGAGYLLIGVAASVQLAQASEPPIRPGDKVVTVSQAAVKVGTRTLATVPSNTELFAKAVKDHWVAVTIQQDGMDVSGWVDRKYLSSRGQATDQPVDEASNTEVGSAKDVPQIELRLLEAIARDGTQDRFMIPQIRPIGTSTVSGKICIIGQGRLPLSRSATERLGEGTVLEFIRPVRPGEMVNESKGTFGIVVGRNGFDANTALFSPGARWKVIPSLVTADEIDAPRGVAFVPGVRLGALYEGDGNLVFDYIKADDQVLVCPGGSPGSIHRIIGQLGIGNYVFTGERDMLYPLTFALTKGGYVYLRGRGTVKFPNGTTVQLGAKASHSKKEPKGGVNVAELTIYIGLKDFGIVRKGTVGSGWGQPKATGMIGVGGTEEEAKLNLSPAKLAENGMIVIEQENAFRGLRTFRFQIDSGELIPDNDTLKRLAGVDVKEITTITKKFAD